MEAFVRKGKEREWSSSWMRKIQNAVWGDKPVRYSRHDKKQIVYMNQAEKEYKEGWRQMMKIVSRIYEGSVEERFHDEKYKEYMEIFYTREDAVKYCTDIVKRRYQEIKGVDVIISEIRWINLQT